MQVWVCLHLQDVLVSECEQKVFVCSCCLFSTHMHYTPHPVPYECEHTHSAPLSLLPCPSMSELINRSVLLLRFTVPSQQLQAAVQTSCLPHIRSSALLLQVRNSETGSQISGPSSSVEREERIKGGR